MPARRTRDKNTLASSRKHFLLMPWHFATPCYPMVYAVQTRRRGLFITPRSADKTEPLVSHASVPRANATLGARGQSASFTFVIKRLSERRDYNATIRRLRSCDVRANTFSSYRENDFRRDDPALPLSLFLLCSPPICLGKPQKSRRSAPSERRN